MHSSPSRYQRCKRSIVTVKSFTSSHEPIAWTRSASFGFNCGDRSTESCEPLAAQFGEAAFADDIGALPIIAAVEHDEDDTRLNAAERLALVVGPLGQAEPQNVHRRAEILDLEARLLPHDRVATVGADDEVRPDFEPSFRLLGGQPDDGGAVLQKAVDLGEHLELERGIALGMLGEEIEEVPLRHQSDEMAMGGEMREIGERDVVVADHACKLAHLLMRPLEETRRAARART